MKLGFLAFLLSLHAHAAAPDLCESLAQIEPKVNYCDENPAFVQPAQACRDKFKKIVKMQNEEIAKNFAMILKTTSTNSQSGDYQTTQSLLAGTENSLDALIDEGNEIFAEVGAYEEDFVLPIYEGYEEDFNLDPHSKMGQEVFRSKECYSEPMDDLEAVRTDVLKMVMDLKKTRQETAALKGATKGKQSNLANLGTAPVKNTVGDGGATTPPAVSAGTNTNGQSSITGVEESEQKDTKLLEDSTIQK
jgi:hypothetical protein